MWKTLLLLFKVICKQYVAKTALFSFPLNLFTDELTSIYHLNIEFYSVATHVKFPLAIVAKNILYTQWHG